MNASDYAAVHAADMVRSMWGDRIDLPEWPFSVGDVVAAAKELAEGGSGGEQRIRRLLELVEELPYLLTGLNTKSALAFADAASGLADGSWQTAPAPEVGEIL